MAQICRLAATQSLAVGLLAAGSVAAQPLWVDTLPDELQASILWLGDHEEGTLDDWDYGGDPDAGGCICNTGGEDALARALSPLAHSGLYSARASIRGAVRAENGNRAVRLMRWTDRHWADGGDYFPDTAYYSAWFAFPTAYNPNKYEPWDPGDGGWWNVFQFKSDDANCDSQPLWTLNIEHDDTAGTMSFYLYSKYNPPNSFPQLEPREIPVREWVHVEALYVNSVDDGQISIWQNGELILDIDSVQTSLGECDGNPIWGIGNYTDHIAGGEEEGTATILFDDAAVSTERLSSSFEQ